MNSEEMCAGAGCPCVVYHNSLDSVTSQWDMPNRNMAQWAQRLDPSSPDHPCDPFYGQSQTFNPLHKSFAESK